MWSKAMLMLLFAAKQTIAHLESSDEQKMSTCDAGVEQVEE